MFNFSHLEDIEEPSKVSSGGHLCPQCRSRYCELPVQCRTCDLTLASAPHLARFAVYKLVAFISFYILKCMVLILWYMFISTNIVRLTIKSTISAILNL